MSHTGSVEKAVVVYNPNARNAPQRERLLRAIDNLRPAGWDIALIPTVVPGHATTLAREAAEAGASVVFACGGDGTINEVVNGLAGTDTALAVLRGGMGNVFAKEVGVPRSPSKALNVLLDGERRRFDLGVLRGPNLLGGAAIAGSQDKKRYFLLMTGVGFDAAVELAVPSEAKRRWGSTSYAVYAVRQLTRFRPRRARVALNGVVAEAEVFWLLAGNTRSFGGVIDITSKAKVDDGLLDTYVFTGQRPAWVASMALRLLLRRHDGAPGVTFARVPEIAVETPGLPVQADGEYVGETPLHLSVAPAALTVLLPRGRSDQLFSGEASTAMAAS